MPTQPAPRSPFESNTLTDRDIAIGLDIGGTNIVAAALSPRGEVLARASLPTQAGRGPEDGVRRIVGAIRTLQEQTGGRHAVGVGIGCAGPLDRETGRVRNPFTLPTWDDVPLTGMLQAALGVPAVIENDADAAALGEYWLGAGRGVQHMVYVTVGTGVGGGLILGGRLHVGATGNAGEIGHQSIDMHGPPCYCGARGCVEMFAAAPAISAQAQTRARAGETLMAKLAGGDIEAITPRIVADAARQGDAAALAIIDEAGHALGVGLGNLVTVLSPERIVMGGGVMLSFDLFYPAIRRTLDRLARLVSVDAVEVVHAGLGLNAGVSGAMTALIERAGL